MKAAREYKEQWEEANWLRLIYLANQFNSVLYNLLKKAAKALFLIIKLLLLTEPGLNRIEKDETWIFRQIK